MCRNTKLQKHVDGSMCICILFSHLSLFPELNFLASLYDKVMCPNHCHLSLKSVYMKASNPLYVLLSSILMYLLDCRVYLFLCSLSCGSGSRRQTAISWKGQL